jgi:carboxypeptidase C (cathepsin A)
MTRPGHTGFREAERWFWRDAEYGQAVLGYVKSHQKLTHVVIRNAGHMVSKQECLCCRLGS